MSPGYINDIKPLFTETDHEHMSFMIDLWSFDEVKENAELIYDSVSEGRMPPGSPWPADQVATFKAWMDGGFNP